MWHQDYGSWKRDGCPRPEMGTFAVMLTDSVEMNGALYVVPAATRAAHRAVLRREHFVQILGGAQARDDRGAEELTAASADRRSRRHLRAVPLQLLHASGHNLSAEDRWHIYISFNACANAPQLGPQSRPDWVVSRNTKPLPVEADDAILERNSVLST